MTMHIRSTALELARTPDELGDGRTVTVRVVSWDTPYRVSDDGRTWYREQFAVDGVFPGADMLVTLEHDPRHLAPGVAPKSIGGIPAGAVSGRVVDTRSERDGLYATLRIDPGPIGDAALDLIHSGKAGISPEFDTDDPTPRAGELITRTDAELYGLALTLHPQRSDARVLAVRSTPEMEQPDMSDTPDPVDPVDPPAPDVPDAAGNDMSGRSSAAATALLTRSTPALAAAAAPALPQFATFGEFVRAVAEDRVPEDVRRRYYRAIDVAGTGDMAGLINVQWTHDVIDIYRAMTPTVQAFSRGPLPDKGLTVSQPIVTARPTLAVQTPGSEIESTKATIGTASWTVQTAAGGQGTTIQAILRSEPSYLDVLFRLYVEELAKFLNLTVATGLYAAADDVNTTDLEYTDAAGFDDLIIDASALFMDTIGRPAEVVGMSVDLWKALAKATLTGGEPIYPSINPMNRHGSIGARQTSGQIIQVDWYVDPALGGVGDGVAGVVGVRDAYKTLLGEVGTMTADIPSTLVRDTAIFQFFAHGKVDATGLIQIANAS